MKYVAPLTEIEIQTLHEMQSDHPTRRARMRAHSILLRAYPNNYKSPLFSRPNQVIRIGTKSPRLVHSPDCPLV